MQPDRRAMPALWAELFDRLTEQLIEIERLSNPQWAKAEKCLITVQASIEQLNESIATYEFISKSEESNFYKQIKPKLTSLFFYYKKLYLIDLNVPLGDRDTKETYLKNELLKLREFEDQNKFITQYYRSGSTYLDEKLFFRPTKQTSFALFSIDDFFNAEYPVSFDYLISRIKANELLSTYLNKSIKDLHDLEAMSRPENLSLLWTESKTALIELAYALQSAGVFNDGKAELRQIVECLQICFQVNLGHYPRTFQEILSRKKNYTNFIDKLRDKLLLRIKTIEEKYDR